MNENTTNGSNKIVIHTTQDKWEADILRTALLNANIRCEMQSSKNNYGRLSLILGVAALLAAIFKLPMYVGLSLAFLAVTMAFMARKRGNGKKDIELIVFESDQVAAMEVVSRVSLASVEFELSQEGTVAEEDAGKDQSKPRQTEDNREERIPRTVPASTRKEVIAIRSGIGEIVHHVDHGYEIRVGPAPYPMVAEDQWDEFLNFSAQRQEFAFLLKNEYEHLYKWLKEEKQMAEFIHLIESTYREVPPPRPKRKARKKVTGG